MDVLVAQLSSSKPFSVRLLAATEIRMRLCKSKAPIDELLAAGLLKPLVALLSIPSSPGDSTKLQVEATWALSCITASMHSRHTTAVVDAHAIPVLASMVSVELPAEVRELSLLCLANIAGENEQYRDFILRADFSALHRDGSPSAAKLDIIVLLRKALASFSTLVPESFLETAAHLCYSLTFGTAPLPQFYDVVPLLPILQIFVRSRTAAVLEDTLSSVANLASIDAMRPILAVFIGRLLELIEHHDVSVQKQAVRVLSCLSKGGVIPQLAQPSVLNKVMGLLSKKDVLKQTLELIGVICSGPPQLVSSCIAAPGLLAGVLKTLASKDVAIARLGCAVLANAVRCGSNETAHTIFFSNRKAPALTSLKKVLSRRSFTPAQVAAIGVLAELTKPHPATLVSESYDEAKRAAQMSDSHFERFGVEAPVEASAASRKRALERAGFPEVLESVRDAPESDESVRAAARALLETVWPFISFERASDSDGEDGSITLVA